MHENGLIRWGILGTANIARASFLPALRAAGGGVAYAVAGRDRARTERYAQECGIERAIEGYANLLADERVDAVYIALPNNLHAEWTIAALHADKAVLCEKPLCASLEETKTVLEVARGSRRPLWEAFVFPFHNQMARLHELMVGGVIGEIREVQSNFHFHIRNRANIRLSRELAGGSLNDVGCYCLRLAAEVFEAEPVAGMAMARWAPEGVDEELQAIVNYPEERRLLLSCGFLRPYDTFARLLGIDGEIRLTNPFHPQTDDMLEVHQSGRIMVEKPTGPEPSFTNALRHIHAVLRGEEIPRHLAIDEAMNTAIGLDLLHRSAQRGTVEQPLMNGTV
jgi:predicted dehydrogenase